MRIVQYIAPVEIQGLFSYITQRFFVKMQVTAFEKIQAQIQEYFLNMYCSQNIFASDFMKKERYD